jgi:hypothetical protein
MTHSTKVKEQLSCQRSSPAVKSTRTKSRKTSISFPPVTPNITTGELPVVSVQRRIRRVLDDADFAIHLVAFGFESVSERSDEQSADREDEQRGSEAQPEFRKFRSSEGGMEEMHYQCLMP